MMVEKITAYRDRIVLTISGASVGTLTADAFTLLYQKMKTVPALINLSSTAARICP